MQLVTLDAGSQNAASQLGLTIDEVATRSGMSPTYVRVYRVEPIVAVVSRLPCGGWLPPSRCRWTTSPAAEWKSLRVGPIRRIDRHLKR